MKPRVRTTWKDGKLIRKPSTRGKKILLPNVLAEIAFEDSDDEPKVTHGADYGTKACRRPHYSLTIRMFFALMYTVIGFTLGMWTERATNPREPDCRIGDASFRIIETGEQVCLLDVDSLAPDVFEGSYNLEPGYPARLKPRE